MSDALIQLIEYSFVYIDGKSSYDVHANDIHLASRKNAKSGIICLDHVLNDGKKTPDSMMSLYENMIGDFNYWAIPYNAPNKAAALVYANLVLEPELQAAQVQPANGFCCGWGISTAKVSDAAGKAAIADAQNNLGDAAEDQNILAKALVSDIAAEYQDLIEADWEANVLLK